MNYLTVKCTVIEIKNSQDELKNWMEIIEKNVELEDRSREIIWYVEKKQKYF